MVEMKVNAASSCLLILCTLGIMRSLATFRMASSCARAMLRLQRSVHTHHCCFHRSDVKCSHGCHTGKSTQSPITNLVRLFLVASPVPVTNTSAIASRRRHGPGIVIHRRTVEVRGVSLLVPMSHFQLVIQGTNITARYRVRSHMLHRIPLSTCPLGAPVD